MSPPVVGRPGPSMSEAKCILIAENDPRAGRELKFALEGRGYAVRLTASTVRALEYCIHKRPDLVIVSDGLPVIDGRTLVDILRSNPNTRDTLCIFLVPNPEWFAVAPGFQEEVVRSPGLPGDVVAAVEKIFSRAERVGHMSKDPGSMTKGDIEEIPVLEVLEALHKSGRTGTLFIEQAVALRGVGQGFIYLKEGEAINALLGQVDGEKALFRLFSCRQGRFEFIADQAVTEWRIRRPLHQLLVEGARQIDQWKRISAVLPGPKTQLRLRAKVASLPPGIHPLTQEILLLLEYHTRVVDVVDNCSASDYQVLRTLHTLIRKGIVEVASGNGEEKADEPAGYRWVTDSQLGRLEEKLAPHGLPPSGKIFGRILIFSPDAGLKRELLEAMRDLPGFTLAGGKDGRPGSEASGGNGPFPAIGEWHLSEKLSLRLQDAPVDELQRPIWSLLSRGAVGALFLMNGSREDWINALRPASDFFQSACPISIGYLILGEGAVQMELKAKLVSAFTLKGDNALFMLPGKQPERLRVILKGFLDQIVSH